MSYTRVAPRDLFNEAKLLKCLGRLALLIHDGTDDNRNPTPPQLSFEADGSPFTISQSEEDGGLYITGGIEFYCNKEILCLTTKYNSKDEYPLYLATKEEDIKVFSDIDGGFTHEFLYYISVNSEMDDATTGIGVLDKCLNGGTVPGEVYTTG